MEKLIKYNSELGHQACLTLYIAADTERVPTLLEFFDVQPTKIASTGMES